MKERKYYGIHACMALFKNRPQDIIRIYLDQTNLKTFAPVLKWCAKEKKAYHIVNEDELEKVTGSMHHEGVCLLAKEKPSAHESCLKNLPEKTCLLYLDGVENPHNLGSIIRTAAHFGIPYILGESLPLPASAYRIAKGGAEKVGLISLKEPEKTLKTLQKEGFQIIATSPHQGKSLFSFPFAPRTIFAIGSESKGLTSPFLKSAIKVRIPGTGVVESLNVSAATALCMGAYRGTYA